MSVNNIADNYLKYKEKLVSELSLTDSVSQGELSLDTLNELLKDSSFEGKAFEIALKCYPTLAKEHIKKYYLTGIPHNLSRFKGNLDIMLDDYKQILGKTAFDELIGGLPDDILDFPAIKDAIDFANDE